MTDGLLFDVGNALPPAVRRFVFPRLRVRRAFPAPRKPLWHHPCGQSVRSGVPPRQNSCRLFTMTNLGARKLVLDFGRNVAEHVKVFVALQERLLRAASPCERRSGCSRPKHPVPRQWKAGTRTGAGK